MNEQIGGLITGWFGIPGANGKWSTNVHVVDYNHRPICGQRLSKRQIFQWCSAGVVLEWIECRRCKAVARKMLAGRETAHVS
jgi:hypothetical protein